MNTGAQSVNTEAQSMNTFCHVDSPIGRLLLTSDGKALTGLYTNPSRKAQCTQGWEEDAAIDPLAETARQLNEYFAGTRREFDLPLPRRLRQGFDSGILLPTL